ncbi:MAG: ATP-binding protein, partial [Bacteroidota bacterium]
QMIYLFYSDHFIQYDPVSEVYQVFHSDVFPNIAPHTFYMAQTANGDFWIGTTQGLLRGQSKGEGFDFAIVKATQNKICASVLVDSKDRNILWIGTKGNGLARLDTRTMELDYRNTDNGLPNNVIYGVLDDAAGKLWLSSNKGIIAYNPITGSVRNFTSADGMQSNEFNTYAFGKGQNGALFFGGINGLNEFQPEDLTDNPFPPEVRITQLALNNRAIYAQDSTRVLAQAIEYTQEITLDYTDNSLSLTFSALEFTAPSKNTFSYYLDGAEAEWAHTSTDNRAAYLNLSPGKYTFKIKAANGDGVWGDKITTLDITILPPWYRTNAAYVLYALLLGLVFWYSRRSQRKRLQLQYNLALEQREAERLKELDAFRSRFYTNITHEFRTPLTIILGTSEQLEAEEAPSNPKHRKLSLIRRNGRNLLNLVNQMLDLSKIEHNKLQIHYQQGDILRYLRYITESYYSLANANNVLLKIESKESEILLDYDPEKMRQIIANLLSNAIKHTASGGRVVLRAAQDGNQLQIEVADTGKGIPAADLPHIFDRYYQADNDVAKTGGTGIGLALTRELVKLLDGSIKVASEVGKGTVFTLLLPIRTEAAWQETVPEVAEVAAPAAEITEQAKKVNPHPLPQLLIIEDNLDVVEYLNNCLEAEYELFYAYNGQAGIERAFELSPDLIISDVMMPEKTGFEVTDTLKNDERTSHIPIVLLTARADMESRLKGLKRGADVYLSKPFHREELSVNLDNLLAIRLQLQKKYQQLALEEAPKVSSPTGEDQEQAFLQKIRKLLLADLDNADLKAGDIAKEIRMSRSNLYAKLSAVTGMSFNVYLRSLRLQEAKHLLQTTSLTVAEVAYRVGFNHPSYFSRLFTEEYGVTPSSLQA